MSPRTFIALPKSSSFKSWLSLPVLTMCLTVVGLGLAPLPSSASTSTSSWSAHLVVRGDFGELFQADGNLYAVRYAPHGPLARGSRLVSIDPRDGKIMRVSRVIPGLSHPTFVDGSIWANGLTYYAKNAMSEGPATLVQINPYSLAVGRTIVEKVAGFTSLVSGPHNELWAVASKSRGCVFQRIDPADGIRLSPSFELKPGPCGGFAIDASNNHIYVAVNTQYQQMNLYQVNAATGEVLGHGKLQNIANFVQLLAVGNSLWIAGGDPGGSGLLLYVNATSLHQIQGSSMLSQNIGDTNQRAFQLPNFGEFPSMSLTGGMLWIGSGSVTACFHPTDWHVVSSNAQRTTFFSGDGFSFIDGYNWALVQLNGNGVGGLGTITSPTACEY
jgi:hypothetical protein